MLKQTTCNPAILFKPHTRVYCLMIFKLIFQRWALRDIDIFQHFSVLISINPSYYILIHFWNITKYIFIIPLAVGQVFIKCKHFCKNFFFFPRFPSRTVVFILDPSLVIYPTKSFSYKSIKIQSNPCPLSFHEIWELSPLFLINIIRMFLSRT